jgi:hypothetical protein
MRKLIFILYTVLFINPAFSQNVKDSLKNRKNDTVSLNVRNIVGFVPSKANVINGWAIGWLMLGGLDNDNTSKTINGYYTNLSPVQLFWGIMLVPRLLFIPFNMRKYCEDIDMTDTTFKNSNQINGLALSIVDESETYLVNGMQATLLNHGLYKLNGVSITAGTSSYYSFRGLMISGIFNLTHTGKGLQIGLINRTNTMTGVQIGLWNQIGTGGFPFINLSFKMKR